MHASKSASTLSGVVQSDNPIREETRSMWVSTGIVFWEKTAFNTTFAQDGFFLYVPETVRLEKPIQIISVMHASMPTLANARNLIVLKENSEARVLVCAHTMEDV